MFSYGGSIVGDRSVNRRLVLITDHSLLITFIGRYDFGWNLCFDWFRMAMSMLVRVVVRFSSLITHDSSLSVCLIG